MWQVSAQKLACLLGDNRTINSAEITGVSTDSRSCGEHDVFIALPGEKFDGHDYAAAVVNHGCPLVVVNHLLSNVDPAKQIVVEDTYAAYGKIGAYVRSMFKGVVIGLTGSAGKTTVKEELKLILSKFGKVYATSDNHNNFVGVPETLCDMDMTADFSIVEMGMSCKGEIARLVSYVQPDIAVITNIYPMHIEFFDNLEGIAEAKAEIFIGLKKNGKAVINADTNFAELLEKRAREAGAEVYKFGQDFKPGVVFETSEDEAYLISNTLCALKVIEVLNLDVAKAASYVKDFALLEGRGRKHKLRLPNQRGFYTLIDNSYSGQPEAMKLAIAALDKIDTTGRKIAVLGKMAELGRFSQAEHIQIGQAAAVSSIDIVIGVCPEMKDMLAQLSPRIKQYYFENKDSVADFLQNQLLQNNDIVLIKGSRYSSKLYQVTDELIKKGS